MKNKKSLLRSTKDINKLLKENKVFVFGASSFPSKRSDLGSFIDDFEIIYNVKSKEVSSVKKRVKVKFFKKTIPGTNRPLRKPANLLQDKKVKNYINKKFSRYKKIGIYLYMTTEELEEVARNNNWTIIANPKSIFNKLNGRLEFYKILEELGWEKNFSLFTLRDFKKNLPDLFNKLGEKIVVQMLSGSGGRGTFFLSKNYTGDDIEKIMSEIKNLIIELEEDANPKLVATSFVNGVPVSMAGCITKYNGIFTTNLQYQLIGIKELIGEKPLTAFCGHDWKLSSDIPATVNEMVIDLTKKIGRSLKKRGAKGIFGIDFMWNKNSGLVTPIEVNPRLLGTYPVVTQSQIMSGTIPLSAIHMLEFLNLNYRIEEKNVLPKRKKISGSHIILFNPQNKAVLVKKSLESGVYEIKNNRLKYKRKGFELFDLKGDKEFLITGGIPRKNSIVKKNAMLLRVASLDSLSKNQGQELTDEAKEIVKNIYKTILLKSLTNE